MHWDRLIIDCRLATMAGTASYGAIEDGALLVGDGKIAFAGPRRELPGNALTATKHVERMDGRWITPGLIDCHTHLVFGGDRTAEFEARLNGASYEEIARNGGGILSTVRATREATEESLIASAEGRLQRMVRDGLTGIEIKSGYGLDAETEARMLRAAREVGKRNRVRVHTTFLGLHALPPEYAGKRGEYVRFICETVLPKTAQEGLVDSVDAFLESIAFTADEISALFVMAKKLSIPIRLHADQLSDGAGAALAAGFGALSADHLEYSSEDGVAQLAKTGAVAVLLPGAFVHLNETKLPPVAALRRHQVPIAIASDCNPGSSPVVSPLAAMSLACSAFRLTPEEALAGMTRNAARALGWQNDTGTLESGKRADLAVWSIERPSELCYWLGATPCWRSYADGEVLFPT